MGARIVLSTAQVLCDQCVAHMVQELENCPLECVKEGTGFEGDVFSR